MLRTCLTLTVALKGSPLYAHLLEWLIDSPKISPLEFPMAESVCNIYRFTSAGLVCKRRADTELPHQLVSNLTNTFVPHVGNDVRVVSTNLQNMSVVTTRVCPLTYI
ncbi:Hypothetical protein NTJ_11507 [Nesidiocoris tenuis]|uniref:Uncharacterized protein n=1 Tax=Nesidiocoris tenuis TaxID=355587 RepID=A0ABN7B7D1_9HEMI|nr:Hypothetical protein NTJ_11507 [Nesidiocoris tenuis]